MPKRNQKKKKKARERNKIFMKLIIGLGNPGIAYRDSRHNIGFTVVKALAKAEKKPLKKENGIPALSAKAANHNIILATPLVFMNLSGAAVAALIRKYIIDSHDVLVVCDDLDLELGRLKIKPSGSSGGHRGLKSIIAAIDCEDFPRLRIGIGRPPQHKNAADYVLSYFTRDERKEIEKAVQKAVACCQFWAREGTLKAMGKFNKNRRESIDEEV